MDIDLLLVSFVDENQIISWERTQLFGVHKKDGMDWSPRLSYRLMK